MKFVILSEAIARETSIAKSKDPYTFTPPPAQQGISTTARLCQSS